MVFYKFDFTHSPLKNALHRIRIRDSPAIQQALKNDLTSEFWEDLTWRFEHKRNVNINIKGEQGSGKSTGGQGIMQYCDEFFGNPLSSDNVIFTKKEFLEWFKKKAVFGSTGQIDENFDFITQTGATRVRESIRFVEQTVRASQINLISCSVATTSSLYNYLFEAFDIEYKLGLNRFLLLEQNNFGLHPVGYVLVNGSRLPKKFLNDYQQKKDDFLKKVKDQSHRNLFEDLQIKAKEALKDLNTKKKLSRTFLRVHCRKLNPDLADSEIDSLVDVCVYFSEMDRQKLIK